ncbi:MAG: 6-carboxytetrahydropterin synthase [Planctomycetota bacterium]|nr:6-carboxytetrahydropterin synthase [Planctomycetota bacterium]
MAGKSAYTRQLMYLNQIERSFSAAHALEIRGVREAMHGHNWSVSVIIAGPSLDADGLLVDFHAVERTLDGIIGRFHNQNLNTTAPFDRINPSAELVAQYIAVQIVPSLPDGVRVQSVSIGEAPGCTATYINPFEGAER